MNQNPFGGQDPFEYLRRQMEEQLRQKQQKNQWQKRKPEPAKWQCGRFKK